MYRAKCSLCGKEFEANFYQDLAWKMKRHMETHQRKLDDYNSRG